MLHTINGILIASLNLFARDPIFSIAFHEREYSKLGVLATGSIGSITLWTWSKGTKEILKEKDGKNKDETDKDEDAVPEAASPEADESDNASNAPWKWVQLHEYKFRRVDNSGDMANVTALKFVS
jgi:hypothetical protein